jgi:ribosomal protein L16 Arg81 hydroxylase
MPQKLEEAVAMRRNEFDLTQVLRPVEADAFFRDYWEKQPLHVARNDPSYYRSLFSLHDLDAVIAFSRPKFVEPGDFKPNGPPKHAYVQGWLADDEPFPTVLYPTVAEVQQSFLRGKTVILTAVQHRWPPAAALCRSLEAFFGCPVHANMYLTPPGAQGFDAHFDGHEVFVLQLEGTKHWRFYGSGREWPLPDEDGPVALDRLGPVTQEVFVQPGDMLYMPRGYIHEAFTSDKASMHLTVGVKVYRMVDLIRHALDAVSRRDARFREAAPIGVLPGGQLGDAPAALREKFREALQALAENGDVDEAVDRLAAGFLRTLTPLPGDFFIAGEDAERVGPDTVVERAPGVVHRLTGGDGWVGLLFPGSRVDGPTKIASALRFIAQAPRFAVRDLPDDLTVEGKLTLVRRLVRTRFLTLADRSRSAPAGAEPAQAAASVNGEAVQS